MRLLIVTTLFCVVIGHLAIADRIKIDVHRTNAMIRTQLLQLTPTGTPIQDVDQFLQQRLHHEGEVVGGPHQRYKLHALWTEVGHYHERRRSSEGLFLFPTVVRVRWDFDKNNKLEDIRVWRGIVAW
jgi:hypothetical protein